MPEQVKISVSNSPTTNLTNTPAGPTTTNTPPTQTQAKSADTTKRAIDQAAREHQQELLHNIAHQPTHAKDDSFWTSLLTILAIPLLLLYALFEIVVKAAPWATGPS